MTDQDARSEANAIVEQIAARFAGDNHVTATAQRAIVEQAIADAGLRLITWERLGRDEAVVYDIGLTPHRCHKITVAFDERREGGRHQLRVRAIHGTIESGAQFFTATVDGATLRDAVGAAYLGQDRPGVHFTRETGSEMFDQQDPSYETQLVDAIVAIAQKAVASQ